MSYSIYGSSQSVSTCVDPHVLHQGRKNGTDVEMYRGHCRRRCSLQPSASRPPHCGPSFHTIDSAVFSSSTQCPEPSSSSSPLQQKGEMLADADRGGNPSAAGAVGQLHYSDLDMILFDNMDKSVKHCTTGKAFEESDGNPSLLNQSSLERNSIVTSSNVKSSVKSINSECFSASDLKTKVNAATNHPSTIQPATQTTPCLFPHRDATVPTPLMQSRVHESEFDSFVESLNVKESRLDTMETNGCINVEEEFASTMGGQFCGSSVAEEFNSVCGSFTQNSLCSNKIPTETIVNDSIEKVHTKALKPIVYHDDSSDAISRNTPENSGISELNIDDNKVFNHSIINWETPGKHCKDSGSLLDLNFCSEVAENIIMKPVSLSEKYPGCITPNIFPRRENFEVVGSSATELLTSESTRTSIRSQTNPVASELMVCHSIDAKKILLDEKSVKSSDFKASQFEKLHNTVIGTNDGCATIDSVTEVTSMMEPHTVSEALSCLPYEESEQIDLDFEFVPFGTPSPGESVMTLEKMVNSTHVVQASPLEGPESKCGATERIKVPPGGLSSDIELEISSPLTTMANYELQDSEHIEYLKRGDVSCTNASEKSWAEHKFAKILFPGNIPNRNYCLIGHNLGLVVDGHEIWLQFDIDNEFFTCPFCSVLALKKETIGQHISDHITDQELRCLLGCNDVFVSVKEMVEHHIGHKKNELYKCRISHNTFPTEDSTKSRVTTVLTSSHLQNHTDEQKISENFVCTHCGVSFTSENNHNLHLLKCSSVFHICSLCEICFQSASELTKHVASHRIRHPYRCELCSYTADNRCDLHFHLNQHRSNDHPYPCPACSVVCLNESSYMAHVQELHCGGNLSCVCCNRSDFTHGNQLLQHMHAHEAHGWIESKVPGLKIFLSLQIMAARHRENSQDDQNTITLSDSAGGRLQFTSEDFLSGDEQDLVSFEMDLV